MRLLTSVLALMFAFAASANERGVTPSGVCAIEKKQTPQESVDACTHVLATRAMSRLSDSRIGEVLTIRARAYWQLEELELSLKDLNMAIALVGEKNPMPSYYRGVVWTAKQEYDLAIHDLQKAISLKATDARFHKNLGVAFFKKGEHGEALIHLARAIKLDRKYDNALFERSNVLVTMGRHKEALADISRALEIGQSGEYYCQRGWILRAMGKEDKAQSDFVRSEVMKPGYCPPC